MNDYQILFRVFLSLSTSSSIMMGWGKKKTTPTVEGFLLERSKISFSALTGDFFTGILEL